MRSESGGPAEVTRELLTDLSRSCLRRRRSAYVLPAVGNLLRWKRIHGVAYFQYYFALGETDRNAVDRVADTTRFFLRYQQEFNRGRQCLPGRRPANGEVDENRLLMLMATAIAHVGWATEIPRQSITPMLGFDWASAWAESQGPSCPRCDVPYDEFEIFSWLHSETEPSVTCPVCDSTALIGDWGLEHATFALTNCGVALRDWLCLPSHAQDVHARALDLIGQRPRYLHGRI